MKKLVTFCFSILFSVLSALTCFNFSFEALDQIESDKSTIIIEKPDNISNEVFLSAIDDALRIIGADIMFRHIDKADGKTAYSYYKTNHTMDFLNISTDAGSIQLDKTECISTNEQTGYTTYRLKVSSLLQDISFYSWKQADGYNLSDCTYYTSTASREAVADAIRQLGYNVTVGTSTYVSGQYSILLFGFVPAFMLIASMAFYILSNGKKNVLKKMDGHTTCNIILDEVKQIAPAFIISFIIVEAVVLIMAALLYTQAIFHFFIFSLSNILLAALIVLVGLAVSTLFAATQKSAEHIKGKVPKRGIYVTTILAKCVFVTFIIFFLSIAVRNIGICYNTVQTAQFIAGKIEGYVTVPVNEINASSQNLADNYKNFYSATVNRYNGILVDVSNYEYGLTSGLTPAEEYGQDSITINQNYLVFNPIFDIDGKAITRDSLSDTAFNVLIPESKRNEMDKYSEQVRLAYSMEVNFINYDGVGSSIYSYNAGTGTGAYGALDEPVILIVDEQSLEGIFVLSYCSRGSYFLKVQADNPYSELLPVLQETGIASVTLSTPSISSTFEDSLNHHSQMLILYGTQSVILLVGLICLILFSAKLYCENYKNKIACCLIEGYSLFRCIRKHMTLTVVYYIAVAVALRFIGAAMQVTLNYPLLLAAFISEIIITINISRNYAQQNLYQLVKGAE